MNKERGTSTNIAFVYQSKKKRFIKVKGIKYELEDSGVIKQLNPKPFVYDEKYCSTYDTEAYRRGSDILQAMRYGFATSAHGRPIQSILDCGYGNGAFLKFASQYTPNVYGYDVTKIQIEGITVVPDMTPGKVITFWDCLEHFHDIDFLASLPQETLCVSLPYCHFRNKNCDEAWFASWKHRKPNEHIRHFDEDSLERTMRQYGWVMVALSFHEDIIRKGADSPNILSMAFRR